MVVWYKILPLAAVGVGALFLINAFTRPAHASQTAAALQESVSSLGVFGESISSFGRGIGGGLAGLFQPVWEVANLFERFSSLSAGSANVSPVSQDLGGYRGTSGTDQGTHSATWTTSGGGNPNSLTSVQSGSGGQFGGTDTSTGWGL